MKRFLVLTCSVLLLGLTGCTSQDNVTETETNEATEDSTEADTSAKPDNTDSLPATKSEDEILLFDRLYQQIVRYNKDTNAVDNDIEQISSQYAFNSLDSNIYTSVSEDQSKFKIIRVNDNNSELLFESNDNEILLPLTYEDEENMYILKSTTKDGQELFEERVICKFNAKTKQLEELPATKGFSTCSAVVISDDLYFTVNDNVDVDNDGTNEYFELYKLNLTTNEKPELVDDKLKSYDLYSYEDKLWVSDPENIYDYSDDRNTFSKQYLNYFSDNYLFQVNIEEDMTLTILDTKTKEVVKTFDKTVDFKVKDNNVTVYTKSEIAVLDLNQ